ncbi:Gfo/Idh/MocA family oxidoreductase [Paenibacillus sp. J5C_2022]|uniref:Gfo/Idh/MocA family protein n=1 Tax=Paenibacillus sp. J5C2022 TaxID=2977129 RepID=UPI0021D22360|nr:Gfo/Idh/MocA family oxidoreductase [Paenibacillus sp. J5C2022]MCU6708811.1 Gfo/Idh/MocA family oxidoreductase [Paenibacillus sp. J5C2022]
MKPLRLGIIGCGNMSDSHGKSYAELEGEIVVTATCDIVLERAQVMADAVGATLAVSDYRDLVNEVDAVLIVLPHDLHHEAGKYFLEAGKHVLMEKPLCNTEEECIDLIHTAERMNKVLMTAYPIRFIPLVSKLKEVLDSRAYGDVFQISIWTEQYTYYEQGHWASQAKRLGGGQFFSHGCHYVDLLLWFLGKPAKGIHFGTNYGTPWMEKEGTSNAIIEFESGALGYHFGTWGARGTRLGYSIHAHCTEGMLEFNLAEGKLYVHRNLVAHKSLGDEGEKEAQEKEVLMEMKEVGKLTHYELKHFAHCIRTGSKPLTDAPGSLQGLRVIWRMYEAERQGGIADLRGLGLEDNWNEIRDCII